MEPITREEYYLAKIAWTYKGKTPKPVTIEEYYLATMAGDYSGNTPQPVTRLQYYMAKVAGVWDGSIPAPVTRLEYYWAAIANGEGEVFPPVTREEHFLTLVADAYSVVLTVVTGNPALLEGVKGNRFTSLTLHGKSTQGSTTGAQLLPFEVGEKREGFEVFKDGIAISGARKNDIYAVGRSGMDNESSYDDFPLLASGEYYVYSDSASVNLIVVAFRNGINITLGSSMKGVAAKIKVMDGDKFRIFLRLEEAFNGKVKAMISKTQPTASNYEPYTGGKPSPSPEYPQEIKSAGQDGEIEVEVLGKNLIPFPYPILGGAGTQIEREGVKYTVQSDGGIRCVGTPTAIEYINLSRIKFSDVGLTATHPTDGKIVLSGEKMNYDPNNHALFIYITSDQLGKPIDTVIYPQIEFGTVDTEYEPYKPAQTLIIPTPNGLPGVPTIDNGNYTDASGQQWLCDEVDLKRGVYVQNVAFAEFGKGITVLKKNNAVSNENFVAAYFFTSPSKRIKTRQTILSNCLSYVESVNKVNKPYSISNEFDTEAMYVTIPLELYENDVQMLNLLAEKKIKILYATYPTERPLSTEELEKYRSLRTYSPTTTVINDAGAGMSVGYAKMK
nr:MAG TPA: hypothetical protein [Caudoviricetes sp.]